MGILWNIAQQRHFILLFCLGDCFMKYFKLGSYEWISEGCKCRRIFARTKIAKLSFRLYGITLFLTFETKVKQFVTAVVWIN